MQKPFVLIKYLPWMQFFSAAMRYIVNSGQVSNTDYQQRIRDRCKRGSWYPYLTEQVNLNLTEV